MEEKKHAKKEIKTFFHRGTQILTVYWKIKPYAKKTIKVEPGYGNEPHLYLRCLLTGITTLPDCCNDSLRLLPASLQCTFVTIYSL